MFTIAETMQGLPARFNPAVAGNFRSRIEFRFSDVDDPLWNLEIRGGECTVLAGKSGDPDAIVSMTAADFIGINNGTVDAPTIFWSGRIEVTGDLSAVIALAPIMGWQ